MDSLYFLIPLSLVIVSVGIAVFVWAVRGGQMDDLEGPAHSILYDDDDALIPDDARREGDQPGTGAREPGHRHDHRDDRR